MPKMVGEGNKKVFFGVCIYTHLNCSCSLTSLQQSNWALHHEFLSNYLLKTINERLFKKGIRHTPYVNFQSHIQLCLFCTTYSYFPNNECLIQNKSRWSSKIGCRKCILHDFLCHCHHFLHSSSKYNTTTLSFINYQYESVERNNVPFG